MCLFSQLCNDLWVLYLCLPLWCVSESEGENSCHQENGKKGQLLIKWILTPALSSSTDHESPRSYASTMTDLGRSAPRERRGTPEKEVVCLVLLESFFLQCIWQSTCQPQGFSESWITPMHEQQSSARVLSWVAPQRKEISLYKCPHSPLGGEPYVICAAKPYQLDIMIFAGLLLFENISEKSRFLGTA